MRQKYWIKKVTWEEENNYSHRAWSFGKLRVLLTFNYDAETIEYELWDGNNFIGVGKLDEIKSLGGTIFHNEALKYVESYENIFTKLKKYLTQKFNLLIFTNHLSKESE